MNTASYIEELELVVRQTFRILHQQSGIPVEVRAATILQQAALAHLHEHRQATMSEFANDLQMSLSSATQLIERLVKASFATRDHDPTDRRIVRLSITREGEQELARLTNMKREKFRQIFSLVPEQDLKELLRIHKMILQKLQKQTKKQAHL